MNEYRRFWSLEDFQKAHENAGKHWFKPDSMRFFDSRVCWSTFDFQTGRFISSEKGPDGTRRYTVRHADFETLNVHTLGEFQAYDTQRKAFRAMKGLES